MKSMPIYQADAFADRLFAGNPAAVVVLDSYPDDAVLQAIAAENNLPETAFVANAAGHYRLRWFTPTVEVPLCGHATLAAAAVVMEKLAPGTARAVFDTASGLLTARRAGDAYVLDFPARRPVPVPSAPQLADALGATPLELLDDGVNYVAVLPDARAVRSLAPDMDAIARLDRDGVVVTAPGDGAHDFVSRYFAPAKGIPEDPVTGGAHCALAPYWAARLDKRVLRAWQASRRGGELLCRMDGDRVLLEGRCVFYLEGRISV